ncbi:MAG TPA: DUF4442 domain-containing protein [Gammaproteobacteria bacterium]|nr:DUF4442 domain-containing protein [Gammaproteobacteria bacterium]
MAHSIGRTLRRYWRQTGRLPAGRWLFSRALGFIVPYTGTLGAEVRTLAPGHCIVSLRERRKVRNHLRSVHAMALANLGEMATGLALLNGLPDNTRGILTGFSICYLKKARGVLTAECRCDTPDSNERREYLVNGGICNSDGEAVAEIEARWLIGPEQETPRAD